MSGVNAAVFDRHHDDVFARIAGRYDRLCDVFSLGIHRLWKRHLVRRMAAHPGGVVLDCASGTGDIPLRLLERTTPRELWVTDICPQMLAIAERKLAGRAANIAIRNAEDLREVADRSVDLYSIAFGMKICDRRRVVSEASRVLKPGGTFYCLEAARIPVPWVHAAYLKYMDWCLPAIGRIAAHGDAGAYDYLLRGVHDFPDQKGFARELEAAGFRNVRYTNLTLGIVALHEGTMP
ncbi:MAG TPA: ubiquinone/menaquinone biosynthesis methyltransferase [Rhizomicrobium sp.]|nr:ubiquinone/menaquinone biosynthesis methyltransferase [Rhizomicrobium sp.]